MMLWGFKQAAVERIRILWINTVNSYQVETAYFFNNWGGVVSATTYTLTYLLFINVIYSNVHTIAGYNRNEMLFLTFISQISFWSTAYFSAANSELMIQDVNKGNLDLILIKPFPSLFYVSLRQINLLMLFRDGGIQSLAVIWALHWSALPLTPVSITMGITALLFGLLAQDAVKFLLSFPVFWKGEAQELTALYYPLISQDMPWEGLARPLRLTFSTLIPVLLSVSVSSSIFLQKSPPYPLLILTVMVGISFQFIKSMVWKRALLNYTSASS